MIPLPFTLRLRHTAALSFSLLVACAQAVTPPPRIDPPADNVRINPARDASVRLLREAYRAYVQERYPVAVQFFQRVADDFPTGPRAPEARWWLGRSQEQVGNLRAAAEQYRLLASGQLDGVAALYAAHAERRLTELGRLRLTALRQIAVQIDAAQLPPVAGRIEWLRALIQRGVTAVVIETDASQNVEMQLEQAGWTEWVGVAHQAGLQVWLALDVHQAAVGSLKPDWMSRSETARADEGSIGRPDIAHPDY